jgi:hypothetical protein
MHEKTHCDLMDFEAGHDFHGGCGHVRSKMLEETEEEV